MTLKEIAAIGRKLSVFLALFADCFGRRDARELLRVYVKGQLSNVHRKTAEAIALRFKTPPRTLQRFLESIKWDEEKLRDRCQQIVARDHATPEAIGCVDESGTTKSGQETVGVGRQYNGNRGKIDNCVVGVHLSYSAPGFQVLLDSAVYLPKEFANDPARRKKHTSRTRSSFVRSHRSPWIKSTLLWTTECASPPGRATSCTVATASSSMVSNRVVRSSWQRFPATFTVGSGSRKSWKRGRKTADRDVRSSIRVWPKATTPAKFATWQNTPPCFANRLGNVIASRTRTKVPRCGK